MQSKIKHVFDFNKALADGAYTFPGGYPKYFVCADGEPLSYEAAEEHAGLIRDAIISEYNMGGWLVIGVAINYEDADLMCSHTGEFINAAYV